MERPDSIEHFALACILLAAAAFVAAGWAWRAAVRDSQDEIDDTCFERHKGER